MARNNRQTSGVDLEIPDFRTLRDRRIARIAILASMVSLSFVLLATSTVIELAGRKTEEPEVFARSACASDLDALAQASTIYFETDSAQLRMEDLRTTRRLFEAAQACPNVTVQVWGHTDGSGDDATNLALSHQRARNMLVAIETMGFETDRVEVLAAGATQPLAQGDTDEDLDRRVEFRIVQD